MSDQQRPSSFLGDLSQASDQFLASQLRRWTRLRWLFVALLIIIVIGTAGLLLGLFGAGDRYLVWFGAFWTLFCIAEIAMCAAFLRGTQRELDRRKQDGA